MLCILRLLPFVIYSLHHALANVFSFVIYLFPHFALFPHRSTSLRTSRHNPRYFSSTSYKYRYLPRALFRTLMRTNNNHSNRNKFYTLRNRDFQSNALTKSFYHFLLISNVLNRSCIYFYINSALSQRDFLLESFSYIRFINFKYYIYIYSYITVPTT